MKIAVTALFATLVASASAAPSSLHEGSWHFEAPTFEVDVASGDQYPSGAGSLDITVVTSGNTVCGHYDGTVASRQPKTSFFDFVGYQANGAAHVYFANSFTGEPDDIGEADIMKKGKTLEWKVTQKPQHEDYLYLNMQLSPAQPDLKNIERLRKNCSAIVRDFGEINKSNARDAASRINSN